MAWFISQVEFEFNIKFLSLISKTSTLLNPFQAYYQAPLVWRSGPDSHLFKILVRYEFICQSHIKLITKSVKYKQV